MTKIIGVDLDEVLAELLHGCIALHNGKIGEYDIVWEEVTDYYLHHNYNIAREIVVDFFYKPFSELKFESHIVPVKGAYEKLQEFKQAGNKLLVITARKDDIKEHTLRFIETYYPGMIDDVHFANHFSENAVEKHDICKRLGIDMMIEDNIDYALGVAKSGIQTFLLQKPWNQKRKEQHKNLIRVKDWSEIR